MASTNTDTKTSEKNPGRKFPVDPEIILPGEKKKGWKPKYLTQEQVDNFDRDGLVVLRSAEMWTKDELKAILSEVNAMDSWEEAPGKWMKYFEKNLNTKDEKAPAKILCRIENFTQYSPVLGKILTEGKLLGMVSDLFGEEAIMYKEKINYKLPGGDGFKPHQDVAAGWWMYGQTLHISALITIDAANEKNGCLELVWGGHQQGMLSAKWKEIPDDVVAKLKWQFAPTETGDVVFFDSFVPHRSGPNPTDSSRRVMYITYGKKSEGDWREQYYSDKRKSFPPDCEREKGKVYEYKI